MTVTMKTLGWTLFILPVLACLGGIGWLTWKMFRANSAIYAKNHRQQKPMDHVIYIGIALVVGVLFQLIARGTPAGFLAGGFVLMGRYLFHRGLWGSVLGGVFGGLFTMMLHPLAGNLRGYGH